VRTAAKKALSRKAMRVATTFTGVAACTATFTPAATAATERVAIPDIKAKPGCPAGTSNWLHLAYNRENDTCLGYSGSSNRTFDPNYGATSFCGGNNSGSFRGHFKDAPGTFYNTGFWTGTTYAHIPGTTATDPLIISYVRIYAWAGNDKCGLP
jgi:hypothetical protein